MSIKKHLLLGFVLVSTGLAVAGIVLFWLYQQTDRSEEARVWASQLVRNVFECHMLGNDVLREGGERAKEQYSSSGRRLAELLQQPPARENASKSLMELKFRKARVDELVADFQRTIDPAAATRTIEQQELRTMLASQVLLHSWAMLNTAQEMRERAYQEAARLRRIAFEVVIFLMASVLVGVACICWFAYRRVLVPIEKLAYAAQRVGAGDLKYRVELKHRDELRVVADNFNAMGVELERRQSELEEKVRDLDSVCYSIAHDLKAPLRAVSGYGGVLREEYAGSLGAEAKRYIIEMQAAAEKMHALIEGLLEFGALTHKQVPLGSIDPQTILREVMMELDAGIAVRSARIESAGELPNVWANAFVLRVVFRNLLSNAIKYVPEDRIPRIVITGETRDGRVALKFQDNGIGIASEHQDRIFRLFERLHSTEKYEGHGVGLAMVRKGVERMNGRVSVTSQVGQGSCFIVELDAGTPEQKTKLVMRQDLVAVG